MTKLNIYELVERPFMISRQNYAQLIFQNDMAFMFCIGLDRSEYGSQHLCSKTHKKNGLIPWGICAI